MGKIIIEDMEVYAYHGHLAEERKIGGKFKVSIEMDTAFDEACVSDKLADTFDYQKAFDIVKEEMETPSSLLEHLADRIANRILNASHLIWSVKIKVSKMNPPLDGNVKAVAVEIRKERDT